MPDVTTLNPKIKTARAAVSKIYGTLDTVKNAKALPPAIKSDVTKVYMAVDVVKNGLNELLETTKPPPSLPAVGTAARMEIEGRALIAAAEDLSAAYKSDDTILRKAMLMALARQVADWTPAIAAFRSSPAWAGYTPPPGLFGGYHLDWHGNVSVQSPYPPKNNTPPPATIGNQAAAA